MATYEIYGVPDVEEWLKTMFKTPPYFDYWQSISQWYKTFEFSDPIDDATRLEEYAAIYQQFRKYIGSRMATVMGMQEHLDSLVVWIDDQLSKSDVYPKNRVDMVYNAMKVDWLNRCKDTVEMLIEQINGGA